MARRKKLKTTMSEKKIREMIFEAGELCLEKKALDVVLLDLRKISQMTDYFLITSGYTDIHVRSVSEHVEEQLRERHGIKPWHIEGLENGRWVLLDYVDFVIHIFQPEARAFYQLEKLWIDAVRHEIGSGEEEGAAAQGSEAG
ncbi:MAG: ribosome silencing factor [Candidatus Glassbacteria bacterium]|nr:ribosome silencing factor [Candidatus Glassbacteria bacterium]